MVKKTAKRQWLINWASLVVLLVFFCLAACSPQGKRDQKPLKDCVQQYWNYRIEKSLDKAYDYEYPLFRKTMDLSSYVRAASNPAVQYTHAEILSIEPSSDKDIAIVKMVFSIKLKAPGIKSMNAKIHKSEKWVRLDKAWFHVPSSRNNDLRK